MLAMHMAMLTAHSRASCHTCARHVQELSKGPAYTIAGKPAAAEGAAAATLVPGPGEYEERRTAVGTGVAVTIGHRLDAAPAHAAATPGPGEYAAPRAASGAAFTMAGKHGGGALDGSCGPLPSCHCATSHTAPLQNMYCGGAILQLRAIQIHAFTCSRLSCPFWGTRNPGVWMPISV